MRICISLLPFNAFHMRKIPGSPRLHNFNVRVPEHGSLGTRLPWGSYQIFAGTLVTKHLARNVTQNTRPIPRFGNETKTLPQSQTYVCDLGMELLLSFFTKVLGYEVDVVNSVQFSNHTGMSNRTCLSCDLSSVCANLESPSCLYSLCSTSETPHSCSCFNLHSNATHTKITQSPCTPTWQQSSIRISLYFQKVMTSHEKALHANSGIYYVKSWALVTICDLAKI